MRPKRAFSVLALAIGFLPIAPIASIALLASTMSCASSASSADTRPWELVWSDEFDAPALDRSTWTIETGAGFGTQQRDYDTERPENVSVTGGNLVLTARQESYLGEAYTSGRIKSAGRFARTYGRFEARIRIPRGQGMWPAFWLLGSDIESAGWPGCGEIDVMESRGSEASTVHGSLHGPGYSGGAAYTGAFSLDGGAFADDFHVFAVEWEPGVLRWYVDDHLYQTRTADTLSRKKEWVFDKPFFVILDLAVGGVYGGDPDASTPFPQSMLVDYVRVYARGGA
jgi:beta-glucanase (GH16 family)